MDQSLSILKIGINFVDSENNVIDISKKIIKLILRLGCVGFKIIKLSFFEN